MNNFLITFLDNHRLLKVHILQNLLILQYHCLNLHKQMTSFLQNVHALS